MPIAGRILAETSGQGRAHPRVQCLLPDPLGRALAAAHRAVEAAPANHLGYHALATALFFRRERVAFRNAAERTVALNAMDGGTIALRDSDGLRRGLGTRLRSGRARQAAQPESSRVGTGCPCFSMPTGRATTTALWTPRSGSTCRAISLPAPRSRPSTGSSARWTRPAVPLSSCGHCNHTSQPQRDGSMKSGSAPASWSSTFWMVSGRLGLDVPAKRRSFLSESTIHPGRLVGGTTTLSRSRCCRSRT